MTEDQGGKQYFLRIYDIPHAGVMSRIYATVVPFNSAAVVYHATQTCCVCWKEELYLASGPLCIVWKETIYVLSGLIFCCIRPPPPFPASNPQGVKERWIYDTCEMVRLHVKLKLNSWGLLYNSLKKKKVVDLREFCVVVCFSKNALWHQHPLCSIDLWCYEHYLGTELF